MLEWSYVRAFAEAGEGSDVDFYVYGGPNATQLIDYSLTTLSYESALFLLAPQADPYVLVTHFFALPSDVDCVYLRFELALKPNATVLEELDCPATPLPPEQANPPPYVSLPVGASLEIASSDYYFTRSQLLAQPDATFFEYKIRLDLPANTSVSSLVAFDFLANDFRLFFASQDGHITMVRSVLLLLVVVDLTGGRGVGASSGASSSRRRRTTGPTLRAGCTLTSRRPAPTTCRSASACARA